MSLCQCGCGEQAPIATMTNRRYRWKAGQPVRFIAGHNARLQVRATGYRLVRQPWHPRANPNGYVLEHVVMADKALGRYLPAGTEVHHVDENKLNNTSGNLVICQDREYHNLLHVRARVLRAGGNPNTQRLCSRCKRARDLAQFNRSSSNKNGGVTSICRECSREYYRNRVA